MAEKLDKKWLHFLGPLIPKVVHFGKSMSQSSYLTIISSSDDFSYILCFLVQS